MADVPPVLRTLVDTVVALVRRSSSGRLALARAADVVLPEALPAELRDVLPPPLVAARAETAVPLEPDTVERILREAWGGPPGRELDAWDPEPVAVTPAAQVHRGEHDGRPVAVKIRRPGVAAAVRNDLALLDALAAPLAAVTPAADVRGFLREARESVLDELDLEHEGAQQRQAARALRRVADVEVPAVVGELTGDDVLVTAWLDGPTLATAAPDDPDRVARALLDAHVEALGAGIALTDARPGHVVLLPDGRVGLLGTGLARPAGRERAQAMLAAAAALRAGDQARWSELLTGELGVLPPDRAPEALALGRELLGPFAAGPARLTGAALGEGADRAVVVLGRLVRLAAGGTPEPGDLGPARMVVQLVPLLARLEAEVDWLTAATAGR